MGAGSKFDFNIVNGLGLAIYVDRFPHQLSITLMIGCFHIYLGFGKGYDEV